MCVYIYILIHTFINLSLKSSHYLKKVDSNHPQLISVQCRPKWEDFEFMFTKSSQMCTEQRTRLWDPPTELWESEFQPSQCSQRRIRVCINIAIWIYIYICMYTHMIILTIRVKKQTQLGFFCTGDKVKQNSHSMVAMVLFLLREGLENLLRDNHLLLKGNN